MWGEKSGFCPLRCLLTQGVHVSLGEMLSGLEGKQGHCDRSLCPPKPGPLWAAPRPPQPSPLWPWSLYTCVSPDPGLAGSWSLLTCLPSSPVSLLCPPFLSPPLGLPVSPLSALLSPVSPSVSVGPSLSAASSLPQSPQALAPHLSSVPSTCLPCPVWALKLSRAPPSPPFWEIQLWEMKLLFLGAGQMLRV